MRITVFVINIFPIALSHFASCLHHSTRSVSRCSSFLLLWRGVVLVVFLSVVSIHKEKAGPKAGQSPGEKVLALRSFVSLHLHNFRIFDTGGRHRPSHVHLPSIRQVRTLIDLSHHVFADGKTETRFLERDAITDVGVFCQTLAANELETKVGVNLTFYQCLTFCSLEDANPQAAFRLLTVACKSRPSHHPFGRSALRPTWAYSLSGWSLDVPLAGLRC